MESANLHHHQNQFQDQLVGSSSLATPSWYEAASNHHAWTPNTNTLNTCNFNDNVTEENICNSSDSRQKNDIIVPTPALSSSSSSSSSMIQDLGFQYHWTSTPQSDCFPKFTELMINSQSTPQDHFHLPVPTTSYTTNGQNGHLSENNQFSGGDQSQYNNCSSFGGGLGHIPNKGSFSQIFPSINISNLSTTRSSSDNSSSINMNFEALDLLTSARFSGTFSEPSHDHNLGLVKQIPFVPHHMQQPIHWPPGSPIYKISPFINGEAKRSNNTVMEPRSSQAAPKKSRLETRACPPLKVRKEKLRDRVASLQQLVAPFGKTDTASVLMETVGHIKFLQNQVETLSDPYMKSSRNKTRRTPQPGQTKGDGNEEPKRDLRSRGLCLVPLSCISYVTIDGGGGGGGGGGIWPHADYHDALKFAF